MKLHSKCWHGGIKSPGTHLSISITYLQCLPGLRAFALAPLGVHCLDVDGGEWRGSGRAAGHSLLPCLL